MVILTSCAWGWRYDLDGSQTLNSEDEIFLMAKQLCMKYCIKNASRQLVLEHAKQADKVKKEWDMQEFVGWFDRTKEKHYGIEAP